MLLKLIVPISFTFSDVSTTEYGAHVIFPQDSDVPNHEQFLLL